MATSSKRVLWKGAISFGLVHIPVALHSATADKGLNFDWLDKRSMDPVGYKRINKRTGEEITSDNIVKGIEYESGQYVILSPEEIQAAYPKTTQTIEIESFVDAHEVPNIYLERPYYISPINRGAKVYALLREVLRQTGKVGIAKVVIQTKQHLAMLAPLGPALVLDLLRWGDEIRTLDELSLPAEGVQAVGINDKEMAMAEQLVSDMSGHWNAQDFANSFKQQIMELVDEKVHAGQTETVRQPQEPEVPEGAQIYDLTEMLRRSLRGGTDKGPDQTPGSAARKSPTAGPAPAKTGSTKAPARAAPRSRRESASADLKPAGNAQTSKDSNDNHTDAEGAGRKTRRKAAAPAEKSSTAAADRPSRSAAASRKKAA